MRFTQIIFQKTATQTLEVEKFTDTTLRDTDSFGSTGIDFKDV